MENMKTYHEHGLNIFVVERGDKFCTLTEAVKGFGNSDVLALEKYGGDYDLIRGLTDISQCKDTDQGKLHSYFWFYGKNPNAVADAFQQVYTPIGDVSNLTFKCYSLDEAKAMAKKWVDYSSFSWESPDVMDEYGHYKFYGFHYFSVADIFETQAPGVKFLIAYLNDLPVGVIKFGVWPLSPDHQGLAFIDVNKALRQRGIATAMIRELNKHLDKNLPLHLTAESEEGKRAGISKVFEREISATKCLSYETLQAMY